MNSPPPPPPLPPPAPVQSGRQGVWQWFISVGCVSALLLLLALLIIGIVLVGVFIWKLRIDQWL